MKAATVEELRGMRGRLVARGAELADRVRRVQLERIDTGHFGTCESCGDGIEPARLELVPYATRCGCCERGD